MSDRTKMKEAIEEPRSGNKNKLMQRAQTRRKQEGNITCELWKHLHSYIYLSQVSHNPGSIIFYTSTADDKLRLSPSLAVGVVRAYK